MSLNALRSLVLVSLAALAQPLAAQEVSDADVRAVRLSNDRDYDAAYAAAGRGDAAMTDLVTWQKLRFGDAPFADYVAFAKARPDWPGQSVLRGAGELTITAATDARTIVDWFGDHAPRTGPGALHLARALTDLGREAEAREILRTAWLTLPLDADGEAALLAVHEDLLAPLHAERTSNLLFRWRTSDAERMRPRLDAAQQALLTARVRLITKSGNVDAGIEAVPASLADHPGLAYDRFNWAADKGRRAQAIEMILDRSTSAEALGQPFRWSGWRRTLARWEMRNGDPRRAYRIASRHFMTADDGYNYSDLEWLSGYLALTYLKDAELALSHFDRLATAVDTPISLGRAGYWQGRALEALDRESDARTAFARAAQHQTSFYGLLAADRLDMALDPALVGAEEGIDWQSSAVLGSDMGRAAIALLRAGQRSKAIAFVDALGETLDADDVARMGRAFAAEGETQMTVLLGKSAAARGVIVPSAYFPLHPVAEMDLPVPPELTLAIARRESEFFYGAGSPVGAQGLMQLMPATAREVSGQLGLPYAKSKLTADWRYNARLGAAYLQGLRERFGDSPVQVAAGYNAGPGRPATWMKERGDPRTGEADIVDWIEHIPFRETRNYVQRVTESLPIYRARLSGVTGEIDFLAEIVGTTAAARPRLAPNGAMQRPVPAEVLAAPRPSVRPDVEASAPRVGTSSLTDAQIERLPMAEGAAPNVSLRPEARP